MFNVKSKLHKLLKWLIGLSFWILGFVLMNINKSYSSTSTKDCSPRIALTNGISLARSLSDTESLHHYKIDPQSMQFQFLNGVTVLINYNHENCDFNNVEITR